MYGNNQEDEKRLYYGVFLPMPGGRSHQRTKLQLHHSRGLLLPNRVLPEEQTRTSPEF